MLVTATLVAVGIRFGLTLKEMGALTEDRHRQLEDAAETERGSRGALQSTVAASAHQQSLGMDQIALAMISVNDQTTQFLTGAQQSQSAAEDLNELSSKLAALTERYRV